MESFTEIIINQRIRLGERCYSFFMKNVDTENQLKIMK